MCKFLNKEVELSSKKHRNKKKERKSMANTKYEIRQENVLVQ